MHKPFSLTILIVLFLLSGKSAFAQQSTPSPVSILSPQPGQALQGTVAISGNTAVPDFQSAELSFAYQDNPTNTWFFITQSNQPVTAGQLVEWDTSALTDGNYTLRLVVNRTDGSHVVAIVSGLRVRNYSPVETNTPAPVSSPTALATSLPGSVPNPTFTELPPATAVPPTITPLPTNPAALSQRDISSSLLRGAAGTGIALAGLGLYLAIRKLIHR